jgi:hypothetical protein
MKGADEEVPYIARNFRNLYLWVYIITNYIKVSVMAVQAATLNRYDRHSEF